MSDRDFWDRWAERFRRLTIFDIVVWMLFVMWCIINAPLPQRHLVAMRRDETLSAGDRLWNICNDMLPFVAAFGIAVLLVRLLRRINKWTK